MMQQQNFIEACNLLDKGKYEEAVQQLKAILEQDDQSFQVCNKLGVAYAALHQLDEARHCFDLAHQSNPDFAPALVNIGNLLLEEGDLSAAEQKYKAALEKDENYHFAYHNLAIVYKRRGQYSEYIKSMKKSSRLNRQQVREEDRRNKPQIKGKLVYLMSIVLLLLFSTLAIIYALQ